MDAKMHICLVIGWLVEAGRIELPSATADNREHSCFFAFYFVSSSPLRTDEDAATTSLIDLALGVQTELLGPAYCATIGIRP
jgi:hypothetical protein